MKSFRSINSVATQLRRELRRKNTILLFGHNGTGKTRLSMAFNEHGKRHHGRDTLYFNAFTEDLFSWDNDLTGDSERTLQLNRHTRFFAGIRDFAIDARINTILRNYADFDFTIDYDHWCVRFSRGRRRNIKISRGEERLFIWCFFLAIVELAMDDDTAAYAWVRYLYIDDPISSLDEHNAIAVGHQLVQQLGGSRLKVVIATHHALFFNVLYNALYRHKETRAHCASYVLHNDRTAHRYTLADTGATPLFSHVAMLTELYNAAQSGELYTYHFNMLRAVLEKTASFHGYRNFSHCIRHTNSLLHTRMINVLNHGNYALYEPQQMLPENKAMFCQILNDFLQHYQFNRELFAPAHTTEANA